MNPGCLESVLLTLMDIGAKFRFKIELMPKQICCPSGLGRGSGAQRSIFWSFCPYLTLFLYDSTVIRLLCSWNFSDCFLTSGSLLFNLLNAHFPPAFLVAATSSLFLSQFQCYLFQGGLLDLTLHLVALFYLLLALSIS